MANIRLLKSHEKLIFLPFSLHRNEEENEETVFNLASLRNSFLRWVQYDDDAFMFCNLNAVFTIVNICDERRRRKKRLENALGQTSNNCYAEH